MLLPSSRYAIEPGSRSGSVPWLLSIVPECYCHGEVRHGDAARSGDLIAASSWERLLRFKDQLISNRFPTDWHRMFFRQILRRYHLFSISIAPSPSSRYAPPNRHPGMPLSRDPGLAVFHGFSPSSPNATTMAKCGIVMPREVAISSPRSSWEEVVKCGRREHPPGVDRGVNSKSVGSQLLGS